jgi:hypothetical protein
MPHSLLPLVCFNSGEWAPSLDARTDIPNYRKALRLSRNGIVTKQGGWTRRPGSVYIANGKLGGNYTLTTSGVSRLQKFQYAPGTAFMLEFGDKGIRFYSNGQQVPATSVPAWVSGTSYPAGAFVTNGGGTFYAWNGAVINSTAAPASTPSFWRAQTAYEVPAPYSGNNFTAPNYWAADVFSLQFWQINDVMYIAHPNYPIWRLTRQTDTYWTMQQVQFITPAMMDENATDTTITASGTTGTVSLAATAPGWVTSHFYTPGNSVLESGVLYNCTQVHTSGTFTTDLAMGLWTVSTIFAAGQVGGYFQLAYNQAQAFLEFDAVSSGSNYTFMGGTWYNSATGGTGGPTQLNLIGTWEVQTYGTWQGDVTISVSYDNGVTFQVVTTLSSRGDANFSISGQELDGGIYQFSVANSAALASTTPPRVVLTADNQFVYGLVQITAVADAYDATGLVIVPLLNTAATVYWSEGAWSAYRGYPTALTLFQERMWYGGTKAEPQRVWGTQTDDIENFALIDQSQATYGLAFDLNASGRGPILWMAAQTDFFVGLSSAEWILSSGSTTTTPITPTAIAALEHSVKGSAPSLPGIIIENAAFYVQRTGRSFQQLMYSVFTNKYMSQDMQTLSGHLTGAGIKQFDFQQQFETQSLLWAVCGDGSLISMTYAMEQEVFGWSKHLTGQGTDFGFLSVQVIYGANGQDDEVWVSCYRAGAVTSGNTYCTIERLNPVDWNVANLGQPQLSKFVYADCAAVVTSPGSNVITVPTVLYGRLLCASLVPVAGTGAVCWQNLVVALNSGVASVTLPNYVPTAGDTIVVGIAIPWFIKPMRMDIDPRAGETQGIKKAVQMIYPRMLNSIGGNWSTPQGDVIPLPTYPITTNSGAPVPFMPNVPVQTEIDFGAWADYQDDPGFSIQGTDPLPFTLLSLAVDYDIGGRP